MRIGIDQAEWQRGYDDGAAGRPRRQAIPTSAAGSKATGAVASTRALMRRTALNRMRITPCSVLCALCRFLARPTIQSKRQANTTPTDQAAWSLAIGS